MLSSVQQSPTGVLSSVQQSPTGVLSSVQQSPTGVLSSVQQSPTGVLSSVQQSPTGVLSSVQQSPTGVLSSVQQSPTGVLSSVQQSPTGVLSSVQQSLTGVLSSVQQSLSVRCHCYLLLMLGCALLLAVRAPRHRLTWCSCRYSPVSWPGRLHGNCHMTSSLLAPCPRGNHPVTVTASQVWYQVWDVTTLNMLWHPVI